MIVALTRAVSPTVVDCELSFVTREPIDLAVAEREHAAYECLLKDLGVSIVPVAPAPELPDAVFVEDTAVVLDELAVIARPGAPSRRPEVEPVAEVLATYRPCVRIEKPGTLDGGDVVVAGRTIYVGASRRTNAAGIEQLRRLAAPYGYEVRAVDVRGCLHLKSACTYLGDGTLLVNQEWLNASQLDGHDLINVARDEPRAANTFRVGDKIVMAAGYPETLAALRSKGYDVRTVANGELEKAEGGVSCKSVIVT